MKDAPEPATEFVSDREIYQRVIQEAVPEATQFLWLATATIKDLYVNRGKRMVPFLKILSELVEKGGGVRLLHAGEPGPAFRKDFDRFPNLVSGLERVLCPRVHFKAVVVEGGKGLFNYAAGEMVKYPLTKGAEFLGVEKP